MLLYTCISIHAPPHGERLSYEFQFLAGLYISIHAPPHGERHEVTRGSAPTNVFQSTLPRTGSDKLSAYAYDRLKLISIHAPPHGERPFRRASVNRESTFQSTLPRTGSDRERFWSSRFRCHFNPRSPARGATVRQRWQLPPVHISIHAPPHGERLGRTCFSIQRSAFQSTLPRTGSDISGLNGRMAEAISIHAPPHGERRQSRRRVKGVEDFNPRSPARGATDEQYATLSYVDISIHAPPHGERRKTAVKAMEKAFISIHAPPHGERPFPGWFSPIHMGYFNPRSPARGATERKNLYLRAVIFQSTLPRTGSDVNISE